MIPALERWGKQTLWLSAGRFRQNRAAALAHFCTENA